MLSSTVIDLESHEGSSSATENQEEIWEMYQK
jgi:hypothetical protein